MIARRQKRESEIGEGFNAALEWHGEVVFERKDAGSAGPARMELQAGVDSAKRTCIISFPGSDEGRDGCERCAYLWGKLCAESHAATTTARFFDKTFAEGLTTCCVLIASYRAKHGAAGTEAPGADCVCGTALAYVDEGKDKSAEMQQRVGCAWFQAWCRRLEQAVASGQTLVFVTRDDGTIGKSQAAERRHANKLAAVQDDHTRGI